MGESLLVQAFVYLTAAVISVPLAKRFGLGSVLGYLLAGVIVGPFALDLVGASGDVMHFAEFGVVMMLFLIGLELRPALLWNLRGPILGLGGLQVVVTTAALAALGRLLGLEWTEALAAGSALALSSTAIVLQTLEERGISKTPVGESSFAILLFQDIAVIPMLALVPLLAAGDVEHPVADADHAANAHRLLDALPGWAQPLTVLAVVAAIVIGGRFLLRPALRFIAEARMREVFTAAALLLVVGVALAMQAVGLSPALGTFLAGVVLAESEFSRELEADIEPFKGLLLGLFFISVGASVDFALLSQSPFAIAGLVALLMVAKFAILVPLGLLFKLPTSQALRLGFLLSQGGEFAFVLLSFAVQSHVLGETHAGPLVLVVALSMLLTPLLVIVDARFVQPRFRVAAQVRDDEADRRAVEDSEQTSVIIAGFGRFGVTVLRLLKANGINATVLDMDPAQLASLEGFGHKGFYGDARRLDLLEAAGAAEAKVLVVAVDQTDHARRIIQTAKKHFPQLKLLVRSRSMQTAYELMREGVDHVERETFGSAIDLGVEVLRRLGFRGHQAVRAAREFKRHERRVMAELFPLQDDRAAYLERARRRSDELQNLMAADAQDHDAQFAKAWDIDTLASDVQTGSAPSEEGSD
ncbi:monovalent cation:proton antiporter-2 (CPA2) family protein [Engelhardtia mirabilis]|uniref:Glutathione-regulated potassium-efflux system protein KefC n=1 Tax=Engelhardtia mirabilis TaxID=2528011 RepID=A0A518BDN0_9BACT|nr:Glutathione-regulated potassium-efflux system protein KefC [Planctomycetes bacterium Pla133]QDU99417.1 Glutathione-regulated potassium-efflux system protein KefC [Planctomycetes bacterium Pla86]